MDKIMKVAIPSHNRTDITTLQLLSEFQDVFVFVNDKEQYDKYFSYRKEHKQNYHLVVTKTKGIQNARNAILDYFPEGEKILMLDDDIKAFYKLSAKTREDGKILKSLEKMDNKQFREFVNEGFRIAERNNVKLWGIYPVYNSFYMSQQLNNKGFIIGSFSGIINNPIRFRNLPLKEDYAYTLDNIIKYKKVLRIDYVTMDIAHYTNSGGCVDTRNEKKSLEEQCCNKLLALYPGLLKRNPKRENEVLISL